MSSGCDKPKLSKEGIALAVGRAKARIGPRASLVTGTGYYLCKTCGSYHLTTEFAKLCEKQKFSEFEAMLAVFNAKLRNDKGNANRKEQRYYFCELCDAYHLSSKPPKGGR